MSSFTTKAKISLHNQIQTEQTAKCEKKGSTDSILYMKLKFHSNTYLCPVFFFFREISDV